MKKLCFILFLTAMAGAQTYAQDITGNGTPHPYGITSSGLGTIISTEGSVFNITGGMQKGSNLFHSFGKFNIHSGESAVFHDSGITNTIGRVTGGEYSWINGMLKSGAQNLYLLNPAGVIFGANASLDLSGSFHVSTADYLRLGENEKFFAEPMEGEMLSVAAPSAFGFLDNDIASVTFGNESEVSAALHVSEGKTISLIGGNIDIKGVLKQKYDENGNPIYTQATNASGEPLYNYDEYGNLIPVLIPEMESFGANIEAPGGRINIASTASAGEIILTDSGINITSSEKGNISISEKAVLDTSGTGGGSIFIRGGEFVVKESALQSETLGDKEGGVIDIQTDTLLLEHGSRISAETSGIGKGSDINLKISEEATFSGYYDQMNTIGTATYSNEESAGDSGNIIIEAKKINSENTMISTRTSGKGNGGDISLKASESAHLIMNPENASTTLGCGPFEGIDALGTYGEGSGKAGNLSVEAKDISLGQGTVIASKTEGNGEAGDIMLKGTGTVHVDLGWINSMNGGDISVEAQNIALERAIIQAGTEGSADGGNITITVEESVELKSGWVQVSFDNTEKIPSKIRLITQSTDEDAGGSGNLQIKAKSILSDEACISAGTMGAGDGGSVTLDADAILFSNRAGILSETQGEGNAGDITLNSDILSFTNGAYILSETEENGDAGDITLNISESINFSSSYMEACRYADLSSGIGLKAEDDGNGGNLMIRGKDISFEDGAYISQEINGKGTGGDIVLKAEESLTFSGHNDIEDPNQRGYGSSGIGIRTSYNGDKGDGNAGSLFIEAKNILFEETANISSTTYGSGNGGDITLKADESLIFSGKSKDDFGSSGISLITRSTDDSAGDGGSLYLEANNILFQEGSFLAANTHGKGNGGNITLKADESVTFSGESGQQWESSEHLIDSVENNKEWMVSENLEWADNYTYFICGNMYEVCSPVNIMTNAYDLILPSAIYAETFFQGEDAGDAGTVLIEAEDIYFKDGAGIACDTRGKGDAGNIILRARNSISFTGHGSEQGLTSNLYAEVDVRSNGGNGGNILIEADDILLSDGAKILTTAFGPGKGGDISVHANQSLRITGADERGWSSIIASDTSAKEETVPAGDGGNLEIKANELILENGGQIASSSIAPLGRTSGQAGEVRIQVAQTARLSGVNLYGENEDGFGSGIYARTRGVGDNSGNAGKIMLETGSLILENGAVIESGTNCDADGGSIEIRVEDSVQISGDAANIQLKEPAESQNAYMEGFSPTDYNQSVSGIYAGSESKSETAGKGGEITLTAQKLTLSDKGKISTSSQGGGSAGSIRIDVGNIELKRGAVSSESNAAENGGDAGTIIVNASDSVRLSENSSLTTESKGAGGGIIFVNAGNEIYLLNSEISSSVKQGEGKGGDVTTESEFVILNHSPITANAEEGDGGAISIHTDNYIKSADSAVTATSKRGNEGTVTIEAPELDITGSLTLLPSNYIDAAKWMKLPCSARSGEDVSRFVITGRDGVSVILDDWLPSPLLWLDKEE